MTEGGEHLRLPSEPRHSVWIGRERRGQDLQCNVAAEFGIPGAIHLSHAAAAEHRADFVRAKAGARSERHKLSSGLYEARGTRPHRAPTRLPLLDDFVATDKMGTARGSGRVSKSLDPLQVARYLVPTREDASHQPPLCFLAEAIRHRHATKAPLRRRTSRL